MLKKYYALQPKTQYDLYYNQLMTDLCSKINNYEIKILST